MVFSAEEKYRFSIYNGDVLNLVNYFKSRDFNELLNYVNSIGAIKVIIEILERTVEAYSEHGEIREYITKFLEEYMLKEKPGYEEIPGSRRRTLFDVEQLVNIARDIFDQSHVEALSNGIRVILPDDVELKVTLLKQNIKIELKLKGEVDDSRIRKILLEAKNIAKKTRNI